MNANTIRPADTEFDALIQSILDAAADDGLLAGRELESDAELLKLPGLSRRDKIQFGWVDPDEHAIERANRTRQIGGKAEKTPIIDRTSDRESRTVDNRGFLRIRKPKSLLCVNFGQSWKLAFYPDGSEQVRHLSAASASIALNGARWKLPTSTPSGAANGRPW